MDSFDTWLERFKAICANADTTPEDLCVGEEEMREAFDAGTSPELFYSDNFAEAEDEEEEYDEEDLDAEESETDEEEDELESDELLSDEEEAE